MDDADDATGPRADDPATPDAPGGGDRPDGRAGSADGEDREATPSRSDGPAAPREPSAAVRAALDRRSTLPLIVVPLVAMVIAGRVGDALSPKLVTENPALLLVLNSTNRYLVLTTNQLDAPVYYSIGLVRLLLPDPFFYALGALYGDRAVGWMERRTPTIGLMMRRLERWFGKARYPLVFIMPNNAVCLLAGSAGMPIVPFALTNLAGTIGRLWLMRVAGKTFEGAVDWLLEQITTYRPYLLVLSIGSVVLVVWSEWRRGSGEIEQLLELEAELEEEREERVEDHHDAATGGAVAEADAHPDPASEPEPPDR